MTFRMLVVMLLVGCTPEPPSPPGSYLDQREAGTLRGVDDTIEHTGRDAEGITYSPAPETHPFIWLGCYNDPFAIITSETHVRHP